MEREVSEVKHIKFLTHGRAPIKAGAGDLGLIVGSADRWACVSDISTVSQKLTSNER